VRSRIWAGPDGTPRHHLLDPSTGEPAFTGLVAVTALAPTALEAETLAKAALLSGPAGARRILSRRGGILVAEDGSARRIGRLAPPPRVRLRVPEAAAA
jgi:thiamine biosynthesis lipoprotein